MSPIPSGWRGQRPNQPNRRARARPTVAIVAGALATAFLLSGCIAFDRPAGGGPVADEPGADERDRSAAVADLKTMTGVLDAFVTSGPTGLPWQIELSTGVNLEVGYAGDLAALLDYNLAQAWSVTVEEPTTKVSVGFIAGEASVDLAPPAAELGFDGITGPGLDLSVDQMTERYGSWPGPVPELPAALG